MGVSPSRPVASLLAAVSIAGATNAVTGRASAAPPQVAIVSLTLSTQHGWPLPASGAPVVVSVRVRSAVSCTFFGQRRTFSSLYPVKTVSCASGRATMVVPPILNAHLAPVRLSYAVVARGADGRSARRTATVTQRAAAPIGGPQQSANWSGYVLPGASPFSQVAGQWTVPALDCTKTPSGGAAIWVGIGGYPAQSGGTTGNLLQTGITTDCVDGTQQNRGWWEEYPSEPNRSADFAGFPVSAGDDIQASVFIDPTGVWQTRVDDLTTGLSGVMVMGSGWGIRPDSGDGSFVAQGQIAGLSFNGGYTAEWIVEDYDELGSPIPLAAYGQVAFTDLSTSLPSLSLTAAEGVEIVQNGVVRSVPSLPTPGGFSVSYVG